MPSVRPGQRMLYNGFEPCVHENGYSPADLEPRTVKRLGLVGDYGHLTCRMPSWQTIPADRAVCVDLEKTGSGGAGTAAVAIGESCNLNANPGGAGPCK